VFFHEYPRFRQTSRVAAGPARLNLRHEAIVAANRDVFDGARVLDLACNDGRWSFAALRAGARHVVGIEARPELCENARQSMKHYDVDPDSYEFVCGDVFDHLATLGAEADAEVDVVLCLGYLYHTYRHTELLHHVRRLRPRHLIVDTRVMPGETRPVLQVKAERPHRQGAAVIDPYAHRDQTLVAHPSLSAVVTLVNGYGFGVEQMYDWPALLAPLPRKPWVRDYAQGRRVTLRCGLGVPNDPDLPTVPPRAHEPGSAAGGTHDPTERPAGRGSGQRWREVVNRGLSRTLGYELIPSRR